MADPFAVGLGALFGGPCSTAAWFEPADNSPAREISVIRKAPDQLVRFGDGQQVILASNMLEIQRSQINEPSEGDVVVIGNERLVLVGDPVRDIEGLTWTCGAEPM